MYILFVWAVLASSNYNIQRDYVAKAEFITQQSCIAAAKELKFENFKCIKK